MSEVENKIAGNNAATTAANATEATTEASINDERAQRRARRQALLDAGIDPYPIQSTVTAHVAELEERYADLEDGRLARKFILSLAVSAPSATRARSRLSW